MNTENQPQPEPAPAAPPEKPAGGFGDIPDSAKQNAMLCHLLGALVGVVGALIMWLVKKDEHPFIDDQGKEATNFQITIFIAIMATVIVSIVLLCVTAGLSAILPMFVWPLQIVFGIIGAMKAKEGETYRYPFAIRIIK